MDVETRTIRLVEPDDLSQEAIQMDMDEDAEEREDAMGRGRGRGRYMDM